jgi:osmotically-inducible protein OsmY
MRRAFASYDDESLDDDALQRVILDRIENDPAFWSGRGARRTMIVVEVDDGFATLTGVVRSASDRRRADILARALGASGVDNRLQIEEEFSRKRSA